jgi:hypothetical protein
VRATATAVQVSVAGEIAANARTVDT